MRSLPKALRPLTSRSFDSISFPQHEPFLHTLMKPLFVFVVNNCLYHNGRLFIAFREEANDYSLRDLSDFTACNITQGLESFPYFFAIKFHFMGFTSTLMGNKDSFLPHFGHFPSYCCKTSSGGLSSAPSYNM